MADRVSVPLDFVPSTPEELQQCLADPWWRLCSGQLYKIMVKGEDEDDQELVVPFKPNRAQRRLLKRLWNRNLILKARQLGFTTLIAIFFLDCALFRANVRCGIVAHTEKAAFGIFRDKVRFAYDRLPEALKQAMPLQRNSAEELLFDHNNSSIQVSTSLRSGTIHYLHVSEFGKICAKFPERAQEVITGSIPAVPLSGMVFIESTAEGREGEFFKMSQTSNKLAVAKAKLTKRQYRFHFYPWYEEPGYRTDPENVIITPKDHEYFDKIEYAMGCTIDIEQRAWYVDTKENDFSGDDQKMWQEYPSTPDEPFQVSTEGCYYTVQLLKARKEGRITTVPYLPGYPVNTFWDIGNSDGCAVWLHQRVGMQDRFIGFIEGWGEPYEYFVNELQDHGYTWGTHYLPHDGNHVRQGQNNNLSPMQMLENLGLRNIEIVPRVTELSHGIQATRRALASCWFDETLCKDGITHIELYRKRFNKTLGVFTDEPIKNEHTEAADALRQFAQVYDDMNRAQDRRPGKKRRVGGMAV